MRNSNLHINWQRWTKVIISVSAVTLLGTCAPLPSLVDQIKTLGELRVIIRNSLLAYYRGPEDMPEGPEYELARRFADERVIHRLAGIDRGAGLPVVPGVANHRANCADAAAGCGHLSTV